MALWDRIKESAATMQTQLVAKKNDLKSGAFRDASMAMCALVAAADGTIDPSERQRVAQLIATNEVLQNFPADDLRRRFEDNLAKLTADFAFGKVSVLQEIAKAKRSPPRPAPSSRSASSSAAPTATSTRTSRPSSARRASPSTFRRTSSTCNRDAHSRHEPCRLERHGSSATGRGRLEHKEQGDGGVRRRQRGHHGARRGGPHRQAHRGEDGRPGTHGGRRPEQRGHPGGTGPAEATPARVAAGAPRETSAALPIVCAIIRRLPSRAAASSSAHRSTV